VRFAITTLVDAAVAIRSVLPGDRASGRGPPPRIAWQMSSRCLPVESEAPCQFLTSHPAIVEDLAQQTRSDRFLSVHRDDRDPTIRMPEEVMTPPGSNDLESEPPQRTDELLPR